MLNYKLLNDESVGKEPTLVIIPGFTGNIQGWSMFADDLSHAIKNPILIIDNLGAGESPQPDTDYSTKMMAEEILSLFAHLNVQQTILAGHSLGGAIAQMIYLTNPEAVNKMFLIASFAKLDNVACAFLVNRYHLQQQGIDKSLLIEGVIPTLFANKFLSKPSNVEAITQAFMRNTQTVNGLKGQFNACLTHNSLDELANIDCNTYIVTGCNDILLNPYHSKVLHRDINNSIIKFINNCGHMIHLEQPHKLIKIITECL
jgi:pimeloyl-ACP methyl ester carboxylesterase